MGRFFLSLSLSAVFVYRILLLLYICYESVLMAFVWNWLPSLLFVYICFQWVEQQHEWHGEQFYLFDDDDDVDEFGECLKWFIYFLRIEIYIYELEYFRVNKCKWSSRACSLCFIFWHGAFEYQNAWISMRFATRQESNSSINSFLIKYWEKKFATMITIRLNGFSITKHLSAVC